LPKQRDQRCARALLRGFVQQPPHDDAEVHEVEQTAHGLCELPRRRVAGTHDSIFEDFLDAEAGECRRFRKQSLVAPPEHDRHERLQCVPMGTQDLEARI
jgi:hypothetical protein